MMLAPAPDRAAWWQPARHRPGDRSLGGARGDRELSAFERSTFSSCLWSGTHDEDCRTRAEPTGTLCHEKAVEFGHEQRGAGTRGGLGGGEVPSAGGVA